MALRGWQVICSSWSNRGKIFVENISYADRVFGNFVRIRRIFNLIEVMDILFFDLHASVL